MMRSESEVKELHLDIKTLHEENIEMRTMLQQLSKRVEWLENEVSVNDGR